MAVAWVPSGATRTFALRFWIVVSLPPVDFPDNAEIADSFDPMSNPASFEFDRRTGSGDDRLIGWANNRKIGRNRTALQLGT